jgi:putative oxidoreductase
MSMDQKLRSDDLGKLVLRIAVGGMMLFHGVDKLQHGHAGIASMLVAKGLPTAGAYGVYIGEVVAPILVLVGFWTRPAAAVMAFNMLVATWLAHSADVFKIGEHGEWAIEPPMFYFLGALALLFMGPGRFSITGSRGA